MVCHALFIANQEVISMDTTHVTKMETEFVCQDGVGHIAIFVSDNIFIKFSNRRN